MIKLLDLIEKKGIDRDDDGDIDSEDWEISRDIAIKKRLQKEGSDHEVSMAISSLEDIAKAIIGLRQKLGNQERNIPGWIQNHIANAENYIEQAAQGFHELKSESLNEGNNIEHDIDQDLMHGEFKNSKAKIKYLQSIITFCNNKIAELQS